MIKDKRSSFLRRSCDEEDRKPLSTVAPLSSNLVFAVGFKALQLQSGFSGIKN
jgi:hypothetical protein